MNLFKKKSTLKILFINPDGVGMEEVFEIIKNQPIMLVRDYKANKAYIVDTGIKVYEKWK